jgi:hypothetical protein
MSKPLSLSATCERCGELDLGLDQLWLVVAEPSRLSHYAFHCPGCRQLRRGRVTEVEASFLGAFLAVEELDVPAEALEQHSGAALNLDDLIDLMLALSSTDVPAYSTCGTVPA